MICAISCASFHGTARRTQNPSHIDSWRRRICYKSIQRWAAAFQSIAARRFARSYSDHIASSIAWITNRRLSRLRACGTQRAALPRSNQAIEVSPQKIQRFLASDTDAPQNSRLFACFAGEKRRSFRRKTENKHARRVLPNPKRARNQARITATAGRQRITRTLTTNAHELTIILQNSLTADDADDADAD